MSTINRIFTDIFVSLSFQGGFPMTAPRHAEPRPGEPAPRRQPAQTPRETKAPKAQTARPAFG